MVLKLDDRYAAMETGKRDSRTELLDAALQVVRAKGYAATRVEDICAAASVTKGSFFHHFKSKEELAVAAARHWGEITGELFAEAPYRRPADPLNRLLAYIEFRKGLIRGTAAEFSCFAGTTVQEVHATHPSLRDACAATISEHVATLEADIEAAMRHHRVAAEWSAHDLALHIQAVIQGAFILAKATQDPQVAVASLDHLRRYVELLFRRSPDAKEEAR
jgi:TetR/AcrR family transcriptional regulator, transcriptional repressor for nem operon